MAELLESLLRRCAQGDGDAVRALVGRFTPAGRVLATALLRDEHLAEDALQNAFCTALGRLGQLRSARAFSAWFRQIVRTEAQRIIRRRRPVAAGTMSDSAAGEADPPSQAELNELRTLIREAIGELTPAASRTAELFYLDEHSCAEIAGKLRIPTGTVKRRLHEARRQLRSMLLGYVADAEEPELTKQDQWPFGL